MSVVLTVEEVGPCRKQLKIEVPAPAVDAETERVVGEYGRKAQPAGLPPGQGAGQPRAPALQRRRSSSEVVERLVPRYWRQAEAEKRLDPLAAARGGRRRRLDRRVDDLHRHGSRCGRRSSSQLQGLAAARPAGRGHAPRRSTAQLGDLRRAHAEWKSGGARRRPRRPRQDRAQAGDRTAAATRRDRRRAETVDTRRSRRRSRSRSGSTSGSADRARARRHRPRRRARARPSAAAPPRARRPRRQGQVRSPPGGARSRCCRRSTTSWPRRSASSRRWPSCETDVARRDRQRQAARRAAASARTRCCRPADRAPSDAAARGRGAAGDGELVREYADQLARRGVDLEKRRHRLGSARRAAQPHAERVVNARLLLDAIAEAEAIEVPEERARALLGADRPRAQDRRRSPCAASSTARAASSACAASCAARRPCATCWAKRPG